jgi:hypothetical protein
LNNADDKSMLTLGFLTVIEHPQHGLFGGYLVLGHNGRPVEFHCTAPTKPNRAQEILYGPTLEPFLYGEQIGGTLLAKAESRPTTVYTDCEAALAVRERVSVPVALVLPRNEEPSSATTLDATGGDGRYLRVDAAHQSRPKLLTFQLGKNRLALPEQYDDDQSLITERLGSLAESFDLLEPFGRIREAIAEAQQSVR